MGVFAHKELNNLHPEQDISPFQKLDDQHTYDTRSVTNNTSIFNEVPRTFT